jgi:hypothetical protein
MKLPEGYWKVLKYAALEITSLPTAPWSEIRSFGPTINFFLPQNAQKLRLRLDIAMHDSDLVKKTHLRKPQLQRCNGHPSKTCTICIQHRDCTI